MTNKVNDLKKRVFPGRIIFDHLPKTAGMSINNWLFESLGEVVIPNLIGQHSDLIRDYGGLYSVISGHIHFAAKEGLDPRYQYITCVRDPVERIVSWLYFVSNDVEKSLPAELVKQVDSFINSNGKVLSETVAMNISNQYVSHFSRILGTGLESDSTCYDNAIQAIKQYDVIGLFDDLSGFMAEIATLIGLPSPMVVPRINITHSRPELEVVNEELMDNIKKFIHLDIAFYNEVKTLKAVDLSKRVTQKSVIPEIKWDKYHRIQKQDLSNMDMVIVESTLKEGLHICRGQLINFTVDFVLYRAVNELEMGLGILDTTGRVVYGTNNKLIGPIQKSISSGAYTVTFSLLANLPGGNYSVSFSFVEYNSECSPVFLAVTNDSVIFSVQNGIVMTHEGNYDLSANISFCQANVKETENIVTEFIGKVIPLIPFTTTLRCGEQTTVEVNVYNLSNQLWVGDFIRSLSLSYYWLTVSREVVIYEGMRTRLPESGIGPGESLETNMMVQAPSHPGTYMLVLTMLQDRVAWFEDMGFDTARMVVNVD